MLSLSLRKSPCRNCLVLPMCEKSCDKFMEFSLRYAIKRARFRRMKAIIREDVMNFVLIVFIVFGLTFIVFINGEWFK